MTGINYDITRKAYQAYWLIKWIVLIVLIVLIAFIIKIKLSSSSEAGVELNKQSSSFYIPTAFELQQALCNAGYKVEVDGEVGKETKRQWNQFCWDREAAKYMTKSGAIKEIK